MRGRVTRQASAVAVGLLLAALMVVAGCGSSKSAPTPSPTASPTSAEAQISADWQKFFAGTTPAAAKIALLQNGQQFASTIQAQAKSVLAQSSAAKVISIKVTSPTTATVRYSITIGGATALANQKGQAVLQNGVWMVSAKSFAALLALEAGQSGAPMPSATSSP